MTWHWPELARDLVVEVEPPTDLPPDLGRERDLYVRPGVPLFWWVDPCTPTIAVYRPDQVPAELTEADTFDGGEVLPGLRIPLADISFG